MTFKGQNIIGYIHHYSEQLTRMFAVLVHFWLPFLIATATTWWTSSNRTVNQGCFKEYLGTVSIGHGWLQKKIK